MQRSPLYKQHAATWAKAPTRPVYISSTETAKLIRAQLKARFPRATFSVRTSKYSGGSSIDVSWTDGPTQSLVESIIQPFAGSGFDGMTDYKFSRCAWLRPDGSATLRGVEAHWGSDEKQIEAQDDGAIPVDFTVDYVFARREISRAAMERALASYAKRHAGDDLAKAIKAGEVRVEDSRWGDYQIAGNPSRYVVAVEGAARDGDIALRLYAARRMVAA